MHGYECSLFVNVGRHISKCHLLFLSFICIYGFVFMRKILIHIFEHYPWYNLSPWGICARYISFSLLLYHSIYARKLLLHAPLSWSRHHHTRGYNIEISAATAKAKNTEPYLKIWINYTHTRTHATWIHIRIHMHVWRSNGKIDICFFFLKNLETWFFLLWNVAIFFPLFHFDC